MDSVVNLCFKEVCNERADMLYWLTEKNRSHYLVQLVLEAFGQRRLDLRCVSTATRRQCGHRRHGHSQQL